MSAPSSISGGRVWTRFDRRTAGSIGPGNPVEMQHTQMTKQIHLYIIGRRDLSR